MAKYYIDYGTGARNETIDGSLDEAKRAAKKGAAYTQKDIKIYELSDSKKALVAFRKWRGSGWDANDYENRENADVIPFGGFGFYDEWVDTGVTMKASLAETAEGSSRLLGELDAAYKEFLACDEEPLLSDLIDRIEAREEDVLFSIVPSKDPELREEVTNLLREYVSCFARQHNMENAADAFEDLAAEKPEIELYKTEAQRYREERDTAAARRNDLRQVLLDRLTAAEALNRAEAQSAVAEITMGTTGLSVPGHEGTWYAVQQYEVDGHSFFLMEPNIHEDGLSDIIVDQNGELVMDKVDNGFDDRVVDRLKLLVAPVPTMPDDSISIDEMREYGYTWGGMLPLREDAAQKLASSSFEVFLLYPDNTEGLAALHGSQMYEGIIHDHAVEGGIFGVEKKSWLNALDTDQPRLFVDIDGTLARFHDEVQYLERMYEPDFFRDLKPFRGAVESVREFMRQHPDVEVYILSSVIPGYPPGCVQQKQAWLDKYLPEIDHEHRLFPEMGTDKSTAIPGGIRPTDVLLDDYNKNLEEWRQAGGQSVKFVNNINDKALIGERWNGERMHHDAGIQDNVRFLARMTGTDQTPPSQQRGAHL